MKSVSPSWHKKGNITVRFVCKPRRLILSSGTRWRKLICSFLYYQISNIIRCKNLLSNYYRSIIDEKDTLNQDIWMVMHIYRNEIVPIKIFFHIYNKLSQHPPSICSCRNAPMKFFFIIHIGIYIDNPKNKSSLVKSFLLFYIELLSANFIRFMRDKQIYVD